MKESAMNRFLQFHTLVSYPSALLNRDDAGFAKRLPFGGATRIRVSSQCLKRHWRTFTGEHSLAALDVPMSVRSRWTFERHILDPMVNEGVAPDVARAVTIALMATVLGKSAKEKAPAKDDKGKSGKDGSEVRSGQVTVLGRPEVDFLRKIAMEIALQVKDSKAAEKAVTEHFGKKSPALENLKALRHAAGLDAALFGRMVTSDILARGDAAIHVAHAFTVHAEAAEADYFSAVDDLAGTGDDSALGSGHINSSELTSGLFYVYVVVDVPQLVSNLEGCRVGEVADADRTLASQVIDRIVRIIATVSPGAKLGSTAPYSYALAMIAEAGNAQPRTLANAFLAPVAERPDVLANAYDALRTHLDDLDRMYGRSTNRRMAAVGPWQTLLPAIDPAASSPMSLPELAQWAAGQAKGG